VLKPCTQRSSMIQRPLIKLNHFLLKKTTRNLLRLGARPPHLGNHQLRSGLTHQPSERARPLAKHRPPLHSDSLYQHLLLVNPLPLRCMGNNPLRTLQPRPLVQPLGGQLPSVNQLPQNLRSEHLRSGNLHLVSPASVSRLRRPPLQAREVVDSQPSRPSQLPLVNLPLVSPALAVALLRRCSVSLALEAQQQAMEREREPVVVVVVGSVPSHRLYLPASHKLMLTH